MNPLQTALNERIQIVGRVLGEQMDLLRTTVEAGNDPAAVLSCIREMEHNLRNELTSILAVTYRAGDTTK